MNTYEVMIGEFYDRNTTLCVESHKVKAPDLVTASVRALKIKFAIFYPGGNLKGRREIVSIKRIS